MKVAGTWKFKFCELHFPLFKIFIKESLQNNSFSEVLFYDMNCTCIWVYFKLKEN